MAKSKTVKAPAEEAKIETKIPVVKNNLRDGGDDTPETDIRPFALFFGEHTIRVTSVLYTPIIDQDTGDHVADNWYLEYEISDSSGHAGYGDGNLEINFN